MKALVIVNPVSGRNMIDDYIGDILSVIRRNGYEPMIRMTRGKDDARQFASEWGESVEAIVCCGGDGTLSEVINGIAELEKRPVIGYIPTGTTNDFSRNMGLSADILKSIIDLNHGEIREVDIGQFGEKHFVYVASFGLFAQSSYATPQNLKKWFGHLAYVITGSRELLNLQSCHVRVTDADGRVFEDDYIYGSVSNSTSIGGLLGFEEAAVDLQDGLHEVVLIRRPKNLAEFNDAARAVLSGVYDSECITVFSSSRVTFESDGIIDWSLDGEHERTEGTVEILNIPRAVRLIFPKSVTK